jgi:hypothetical protein
VAISENGEDKDDGDFERANAGLLLPLPLPLLLLLLLLLKDGEDEESGTCAVTPDTLCMEIEHDEENERHCPSSNTIGCGLPRRPVPHTRAEALVVTIWPPAVDGWLRAKHTSSTDTATTTVAPRAAAMLDDPIIMIARC